jgi:hypothetical protein
MTSPLFMFWKDEVEMFRIEDGIKDGENCTSRVADWNELAKLVVISVDSLLTNVFYTLSQHHLVEDLATTETDESGGQV